jgi:hypothetical protein
MLKSKPLMGVLGLALTLSACTAAPGSSVQTAAACPPAGTLIEVAPGWTARALGSAPGNPSVCVTDSFGGSRL